MKDAITFLECCGGAVVCQIVYYAIKMRVATNRQRKEARVRVTS